MKKILLVDCNNFYVSCERIFNPEIRNKPVVVLSSNDAVIISRSNEAKALGIGMEPAFKCERIFKQHNVIVYSANFTLYGDISARVMQTIAQFATELEVYSVDEAFLHIAEPTSNKEFNDIYYTQYAKFIRRKIKQMTGIPVTIGIGYTKTLAKMANKIAKKDASLDGVFDISSISTSSRDSLFANFDIKDIWGIGSRYTKFLNSKGIKNALEFTKLDPKWVRKNLTVNGLRTLMELNGTQCISMNEVVEPRQTLCVSRSFGIGVTSLAQVKEALSTYITKAAQKLRDQNSLASCMDVFLYSNRYHETDYYYNSTTVVLPIATAYTPDLIEVGHKCLEQIYRQGYQYKKVGVILSGLVQKEFQQLNLCFEDKDLEKKEKFIKTFDKINNKFGSDKVFFASSGIAKPWKTRQGKKSQCYTTNWHEILTINLK